LLWALLLAALVNALQVRVHGDEDYDEAALREWIDEARVFRAALPELVRDYLDAADPQKGDLDSLESRAHEIREQIKSLADPTKMYQGQLPLFPTIYRIELQFSTGQAPELPAIVWESKVPRPQHNRQVRELDHWLLGSDDHRARVRFEYQMHAYNRRQREEQAAAARLRWVGGLALVATALVFLWIYLVQQRARQRERRRLEAQQKIDSAERLLLENELRRQEAERKHEDVERRLLEQRLATQAAESQTLELKSQLYASIGIMAGSYAHNIKNLLVRPNDLLRRCLDEDGRSSDRDHMLREVRQTLGTVTDRLQQILQTVRRDPSQSELTQVDLNAPVQEIHRSWEELARDKWKLELSLEAVPENLWILGDVSHLQQAVENLLFNARDATFEMRGHLRDQARQGSTLDEAQRREALIAAASWRGAVVLRTYRDGASAVLEVRDNGIGMSAEVRQHCTETHFSTKRNNAIYEGNSTGMGLGLSFVSMILEHHRGVLEIESEPERGTLFRLSFPLISPAS
jgi:signal transduction histidine kinase